MKGELDQLAESNPEDFKLFYTVDRAPPKSSKWPHGVGFVTKEMLQERMPAPSMDTMILYCGPPVFTDMLTKLLTEELGYCESMLFKF